MQRTSIEWAKCPDGSQGFSLNIMSGCLHPCRSTFCYAASIARRFGKTDRARKFLPEWRPERIEKAKKRRKPATIFLGSAADMWGSWVKDEQIDAILKMVEEMPHCVFLTLTKNPERYVEVAKRRGDYPDNLWLGASAVNQEAHDRAQAAFTELDCVVSGGNHFVSLEPLHGPIQIVKWWGWVICGRETGPSPTPCDPSWAKRIAEDASSYGTPLFIKDSLKEMCEEEEIPFQRDLPYLEEV